jgi:Domain of unknown function (DUF4304)
MARSHSPAEAMLNEVVARAFVPPLKAAGFRKTGLNFHRRRGETVQVVNVQVSHGSTAMAKTFYVNAGIAFDAICRLAGRSVLERPKEYECSIRGMRDRLEHLVPGLPAWWNVGVGDDTEAIAGPLRVAIDRLVAELDRIDGVAAYRDHPWFDRSGATEENIQVLYLLGDLDGAWREIEALTVALADRQNANRAEWWVERLGLTDLAPRLGGPR